MSAYTQAIISVTDLERRRAALQHQAELAERERNFPLAQELTHRADAVGTVSGTQVVQLPLAGTLDELWEELGFGVLYPGTEWSRREPVGIHRRLAAGLSSIMRRGTTSRGFTLGSPLADGRRPFVWESTCGRWTARHWRVSGLLDFTDDRLVADEVIVAVKSTAALEQEGRVEWTAFIGGPLNSILTERLNWVTAQFAARDLLWGGWKLEGWAPEPLTEEEEGQKYDSNPHPVGKWVTPHGLVVLDDDQDGSAWLDAPAPAVEELVCLFWQTSEAVSTDVDTAIPVSGYVSEA